MSTPIPLHQPTQYPSTLALAAIPSFHGLVHHMCAHHTPSHQPLLTFVGMCTQFQQSPIFHLIVIDFAPAHCILGPSLPNSTLLSNFLLSTFHTIVDLPGVSSVLRLGRSFGGFG